MGRAIDHRNRRGFLRRDEWYSGSDRRATPPMLPPNPREFVLAGLLLLVIALPFALLPRPDVLSETLRGASLNAALGAMTSLLAAIVGASAVMRWRLTGEAPALRIGVATLLIGVATAVPVVALVEPRLDGSGALSVGAAAALAAMVMLGHALVAPEIESGMTQSRITVRSGMLLAGLTTVFMVIPTLTVPLRTGSDLSATVGQPTAVRAVTMVAAGGLAVAYTLRGLRRRRWLHTWIGLMLFGLALSLAFRMSATYAGDPRLTGTALLALCGLLFALNGSARELAAAYADQRAALFDSTVQAGEMASLHRAERAAREEQAHNATSALLAIQTAIRVLERESTSLDDGPRTRLVASLDTELNRLRQLLASDPGQPLPRAFRIAEAIESVAICRGASGARVFELVPAEAHAFGHPTIAAEIVDNLVANAQRYAGDSPIFIRYEPAGDRVHIRVEDCGPGIAPADRDRIFLRGERGAHGGSGLGLFVARRLARDEGGDLWVEDSEHGGAAFVLALPGRAASSLTSASPAGHEDPSRHDDGRQRV